MTMNMYIRRTFTSKDHYSIENAVIARKNAQLSEEINMIVKADV